MFQVIQNNYQFIIEIAVFLVTVLGFGWKGRSWIQTNILTELSDIKTELEKNGKMALEAKEAINKISKISSYELGRNGGGSTKDIIVKTYNICKEFQERDEIHFYLDSQPKFECDSNGYTLKLNKKLLDILGITEQEGLGYGWMSQLVEYDKTRVLREWEEAVEINTEFSSVYTFVNKSTGVETRVKGVAIFKRDGDKEIKFVLGTLDILKITEKKEGMRRA